MSLKFTTCRHNGTIKEINNNDEKKIKKPQMYCKLFWGSWLPTSLVFINID